MEPDVILKMPYARVVVPEADGSYTAEILEFPGCVASGETAAGALSNVEEVALDWLAASLEQGQNIPEPLDHSNFSGKLVVRMPKGLHKRAARLADREGVSLNHFIVTCIAEQVGTRAHTTMAYSPQTVTNWNVQNGIVISHGGNLSLPSGTGGWTVFARNTVQTLGAQTVTSADVQLLDFSTPFNPQEALRA